MAIKALHGTLNNICLSCSEFCTTKIDHYKYVTIMMGLLLMFFVCDFTANKLTVHYLKTRRSYVKPTSIII